MFGTKRRNRQVALFVTPFLLWIAQGSARAQSFSAPLAQCKSVAVPAALADCPATNDPLKEGIASINNMGDVTVGVSGAATDTTYTVTFVSGDGSSNTMLSDLKTDNKGDGALRKDALFKFGIVGAGNVVLSNAGNEEFVSGLIISSNGLESAADFQPGLVRCADVVVPAPLTGCGSDPLNSGRVDVENPSGAFSIHISGATPGQSYTAILRAPGGTPIALGTVGPTNSRGDASLDVADGFAAGTVGSDSAPAQQRGPICVRLQGGSEVRAAAHFRVKPGSLLRGHRSGPVDLRQRSFDRRCLRSECGGTTHC